LVNDTLKSIYVSGYPLNFEEKRNGTKWLTTLTEGKNSVEVRLYTFDEYFNLIDDVSITRSGGDQGYRDWSLGTFKNDSTYAMKEVFTGFNTDSIEVIRNYCLIVKSDGKIHRLEDCQ